MKANVERAGKTKSYGPKNQSHLPNHELRYVSYPRPRVVERWVNFLTVDLASGARVFIDQVNHRPLRANNKHPIYHAANRKQREPDFYGSARVHSILGGPLERHGLKPLPKSTVEFSLPPIERISDLSFLRNETCVLKLLTKLEKRIGIFFICEKFQITRRC